MYATVLPSRPRYHKVISIHDWAEFKSVLWVAVQIFCFMADMADGNKWGFQT